MYNPIHRYKLQSLLIRAHFSCLHFCTCLEYPFHSFHSIPRSITSARYPFRNTEMNKETWSAIAPTNDTCSDRIKPTKFAPRQKKAIKNRSLKARVHANEPMFRWFPHGLRKHGSSAYYNRFHLNGRC